MLSFCSIGIRVILIFFFKALVPLNFLRLQNFIAVNPEGQNPSVVTAKLECMKNPGTLYDNEDVRRCISLPEDGEEVRYSLRSLFGKKTPSYRAESISDRSLELSAPALIGSAP